jgi:menaquinone-dependent protoporphyrinogen IX oxidase
MLSRRTTALALSFVAATAAHTATRRIGRTWGATYSEAAQSMPGDDLVPDADSQVTMAITIDAPPERVWPWLVQMGVDRAGLYTHTWLENGVMHLGVRNAGEIRPEWQDLKVGDHIWFLPESYPTPRFGPRVVALESPHHVVCVMGDEPGTPIGSWQFALEPQGEGTRLLFRTRGAAARPRGLKLFDLLVEPGYMYMEAGMMRGIADRADAAPPAPVPVATPPLADPDGRPLTALVAVASAQGTTREVARTIAAELRRAGVDAELRDAAEVSDVAGYGMVVLGSCIHSHHWLPQAVEFVDRHGPALRQRPTWLFTTGLQAIDTGQPWAQSYPEGIERLIEASGAREHRIFAGARVLPEPKALWAPIGQAFVRYAVWKGLAPKAYRMRYGDYRDWDAIRGWAREIAATMRVGARMPAA